MIRVGIAETWGIARRGLVRPRRRPFGRDRSWSGKSRSSYCRIARRTVGLMAVLFGRRLEVDVAGLNIKDLRINVELECQIDKTQDKGHVLIYNLRPAHEQQIEERGNSIRVLAGYPQTTAILFEGQVQRVLRAREHLSQITRVDLGDLVRQKDRLGGVSRLGHPAVLRLRRRAPDQRRRRAVQSHAEGTDHPWSHLPQHRGAAGRRPRLRRTLQCPVDRRKERLPEPRSSSSGVARRDLNQARRVRQTCVQGTALHEYQRPSNQCRARVPDR